MKMTKNERYWIAINQASCAISQLPMTEPTVTPTPEQLLGFPTLEEAEQAQKVCLTAPIPEVTAYLRRLTPRVNSGEIRVIEPAHPEPPGDVTCWSPNVRFG